jgi:hypothetical protein
MKSFDKKCPEFVVCIDIPKETYNTIPKFTIGKIYPVQNDENYYSHYLNEYLITDDSGNHFYVLDKYFNDVSIMVKRNNIINILINEIIK